jgi:hypothetical protein
VIFKNDWGDPKSISMNWRGCPPAVHEVVGFPSKASLALAVLRLLVKVAMAKDTGEKYESP